MKNKKGVFILTLIIAIIATGLLMYFFGPFKSKQKEKESQETLNPVELEENEDLTFSSQEDYLKAMGYDESRLYGDSTDNKYYPFRVEIENREILFEQDNLEYAGAHINQYLSAYLDEVAPGDEFYTATIKENSFNPLSMGCFFMISIPDLDNLQIKAFNDYGEHFKFMSSLDKKEEKEYVDFSEYIMNEVEQNVIEDFESYVP